MGSGVSWGVSEMPKRVVVGVSGGSGMPYALDLLQTLRSLPVETHLVVTNGAKQVIPTELDETALELEALADVIYKDTDLGAAVSSGSFRAHGMVVSPCSAGTLAKVAHGLTGNLLSRAAHVALERYTEAEVLARTLDLLGIDNQRARRWKE